MQRTSPLRARRKPHAADPPAGAPLPWAEALLALSPDGLATLRTSGLVGVWSPAAERLTGRVRASVRRLGLPALFRDPSQVHALLAKASQGRRPVAGEAPLLTDDGREVPLRLHVLSLGPSRPAPGEDGDPDAFVLLLQDLSEVHTIRRRLIETEKLSAMAKIAGSVAHEFRNPLNSLFLSADLLEDELSGEEAGETIAPTLTAIREEVERLNQIITHYLALSKISGGERERVDLSRLVEEFAEEWRPRAAQRGAVLKVKVERGPCPVLADPNQLRRVLVNLLENALDAAGRGSAPTEGRAPGHLSLSVRRMRRSVRLCVADDGAGMAPAVLGRLFEPFTTTKAGGTGLGLYLVREMVLAHGGTIQVDSAPARGTRVRVRLPVFEAARARGSSGGA